MGKKQNGPPATPATPTSPAPASAAAAGPSLFNVVMLYLSLVGLGVIGGYGAFYYMFSQRCVNLLAQSEASYNQSRDEWEQKYLDAVSDKEQCLSPLYQAQGRLEAQDTLAERYQQLLLKQEDTLAKLSALQQSKEESSGTLVSLRAQIAELDVKLGSASQKLKEGERENKKLEEQVTMLTERAESVDTELESKLEQAMTLQESCHARLGALETANEKITSYVQQRANRLCRMEYGKGPFHVEFTLKFSGQDDTASFQIELAPLMDMPHTIFVFLELIDLHLYDGTTILGADGRFIEGGNPAIAIDSSKSVGLTEKFAKFGYHPPLAFPEYSPAFPHKEFSIGFVEDGPTFAINMIDNSYLRGPEERNESCFGKVVSGFETLTRLQNEPKQDDEYQLTNPVEIVSVLTVRPE